MRLRRKVMKAYILHMLGWLLFGMCTAVPIYMFIEHRWGVNHRDTSVWLDFLIIFSLAFIYEVLVKFIKLNRRRSK